MNDPSEEESTRTEPMRWWIYYNGEVSDRPYTKEELAGIPESDPETQICRVGSQRWIRAGEEPELSDLFHSSTSEPSKEPRNEEERNNDGHSEQEQRVRDKSDRCEPPDPPAATWVDSINWPYVGGFLLVMLVGGTLAVTIPEDFARNSSKGNSTQKDRGSSPVETSTAGVDPTTSYEVTPLFDEAYRSKLADLFERAEKRIFVAMYMIKSNALRKGRRIPHEDDWVLKVLKPLVKARDRDVDVRVMLSEPQPNQDPRRTKANKRAKKWLEEHDVTVTYNESSVELHDKVVLVDNKWVVQGSHNWTPTGIGENREASLLLKATGGDTWSWNRYWTNLEKGRTMR